jgi:hypothetical protein
MDYFILRHLSGAVLYFCKNSSEEKQLLLAIGITNSFNLSIKLHFMIFKLILKHQNN